MLRCLIPACNVCAFDPQHQDAASVGLPVSVQVVGLPFQDELVLRGAKEIETLTNFQDTARLRARLAAQAFGLA